MKRKLLVLAILSVCFSFAQTTVNLSPTQDNSIYSESSNSNGIGRLYSGRTNSGNNRRALLQFDLSSIPSTALITSVTLTLNVDQVSSSTTDNFSLHKITTPWGEGTSNGGGAGGSAVAPDATWTDAMLGTSSWTTAGGDYDAVASQTLAIDNSIGNKTFTSNPILLLDVQNWVNGNNINSGWILIGDETTNNTTRRFGSKDAGTAPVLSITYFQPTTVNLTPIKDNTIFQSAANNSNGAGVYLFSGLTCNNTPRRALMKFDLSSIPSDATILSVSFSINSNRAGFSASPTDVYALHRMTSDWGEGNSHNSLGLGAAAVAPDATWDNAMFPSTAWTNSGGDFIGTPSSSAPFAPIGDSTIPSSGDLVADVQNWVDGVNTNYGWILLGSEGDACTARRFGSRENTGNEPTLTIVYDSTLSTPESSQELNDITVFPNPSDSGVFNIKTQNQLQNIVVFDTLGKLVKTISDFTSESHTIDLSSHSNGVYFLKIADTNGNTIVKRLIKK
jgi:hypothetical protein